MSIGIALASGLPASSGLISAIIGGILVGGLSSSSISVSGPAAGLIAVSLSSIAALGNPSTFFLALFLSGMIQIAMGFFRFGFLSEFIPSSVIQGMMCAIGLLLILNQLPFAIVDASSLGDISTSTNGLFSLKLPNDVADHINMGALTIFIATIVLVAWLKLDNRVMKFMPVPFLAIVLGTIINELFEFLAPALAQHSHLGLETIFSKNNQLFENSSWLDWQVISNVDIYLYAILIAAVSSFETIVNIKASERLNNYKSRCSKNRELVAQGIGNLCSGLLGGLPISALIARSSLNINAGATSKASTIFHGVLILALIVFLPGILNMIPPASLAAVLCYIGFKLTTPSIYLKIYRQGRERFISFIASLLAIILLGLWHGLLIGIAISIFYILKSNSKTRLDIFSEQHPTGIVNRLILPQQTTFLHKAMLVRELEQIPSNSSLIIDAHYSTYIDSDILLFIEEFRDKESKSRNISLNLVGFKQQYRINDQIHFINVPTRDTQLALTPHCVLNIFMQGNKRFLKGDTLHRNIQADIEFTQNQQHPIGIVLGCIDSRVPVETIFDMSLGDLFCARIAGNVVNEGIIGSMEYACKVAGAKLIVVLGHLQCGAVKSACDSVELGNITNILKQINTAIQAETNTQEDRNSKNSTFVENVTHLNIANTMIEIYLKSSIIKEMVDKEEICIVGANYDVATGKVTFSDYLTSIDKLVKNAQTPIASIDSLITSIKNIPILN